MAPPINIDDLRQRAKRRLPRAVFDFIDGGAEDEVTLRRNRAAFQRLAFSPQVLVDVGAVDLSTTVLGQAVSLPVILAPTGLCGMAAPQGELPAARAAAAAGTVFTISTLSGVTMEQAAQVSTGPKWFQLYVWRDRDLTRALVERAAAAGYTALMVTADVPVLGQRERDIRNGATIPPRITLANALDSLTKLPWLWGMARAPRVDFANFTGFVQGQGARILSLGAFVNSQFDPTLNWQDVAWLRSIWRGPLAVKGVMSADDAVRAADAGADAVIVSNHGGRQLDGLPAPIEVLPEAVDAVAGRIEVLMDGGIRRGTDVVKALALGAKACMIGRPYLYGLGASGQTGVEQAIGILRAEMARTLALLGRPRVTDLDRPVIREQLAPGEQ
ncbi:MAG: alpha-hydroxy acid oxidase [Chloroflexota bacterium]